MTKKRWALWLTVLLMAAGGAYFLITLDHAGIRAILMEHRALIPLLLVIALMTQLIKASRMYMVMMDTNLSYSKNLLLYSSTTIINILVPYKIGEVYRIALYGNCIKNYAGGAVRVLIDRAVDAASLITYLTVILLFHVSAVLPLYLLLVALFVLLCAAWFAFPQLYRFWNDYLISQRHTPSAVKILKTLWEMNRVYEYIRKLIRGRVFIMYLLSLAAWGLELIGIYALTVFLHSNSASQISAYLNSALSIPAHEHQQLYALCFLLVLAVLMLGAGWRLKRRVKG